MLGETAEQGWSSLAAPFWYFGDLVLLMGNA